MTDASDILVVKKSFVTGSRVVREGETFSADHPLVKGRESYFRSITDRVDYGTARPVEAATANPGEKRTLDRSKATKPRRRG